MKWIQNIRRDNWIPSQHSRICSDHFIEGQINRLGQRVELRLNAIPIRFKSFPRIYKKQVNITHRLKVADS